MTNFKWSIVSIPSYSNEFGKDNVVFQVNWECRATEVNADVIPKYFALSSGSVPVTYNANSSFTPYDELTEEQVWGWVNSFINREEIETNLQKMIEEQKSPKIINDELPWLTE